SESPTSTTKPSSKPWSRSENVASESEPRPARRTSDTQPVRRIASIQLTTRKDRNGIASSDILGSRSGGRPLDDRRTGSRGAAPRHGMEDPEPPTIRTARHPDLRRVAGARGWVHRPLLRILQPEPRGGAGDPPGARQLHRPTRL